MLRFFAFIMVYLNHAHICSALQGHTFFFLLSGFIITHSAFHDISQHNKLNLKKYFAKRWLRTLPLFYVLILITQLYNIYSTQVDHNALQVGTWWWFALCIHNYFPLIDYAIIGYVWSLAVTEQYYVVLGGLLFYFKKYLFSISMWLLVTSIIFNLLYPNQYTHLLKHIGSFSIGTLLYIFKNNNSVYFQKFINLNHSNVLMGYCLAFLCLYVGFVYIDSTSFDILKSPLLCVGFSYIVLNQCCGVNKLIDLARLSWFIYPGQLSYGMYMIHGVLLVGYQYIVTWLHVPFVGLYFHLFLLALVYIIAIFSYEFFEKPVLRLAKLV